MGIAVPAPSITGVNIGGIFSNGAKVATGGLGPVIIGLGAIFASQSLGEGSDKIPGVTGQPQEGGLNNPGVMMGGKTQTQSQSKVEEKDATCTADNQKCKKKEEHRGNIQSQEGTDMLIGKGVPTPSLAKWLQKTPPSYFYVMRAIDIVRKEIELKKGKSFQQGADIATKKLKEFYESKRNDGVYHKHYTFSYFNGVFAQQFPRKDLKNENSRRIDGTVFLGHIMGKGN
ncbi:hypothetical protein [Acinetobacter lanii]|uniref:Uncharacterized protein n=1 Tax=Acinetobacter lanii TaxID=2715163 RepID=A0A6G8S4X6_9GAMM|nr:hypothetical protein [Acinetobacter lanii]QIO09171.1 hypothetical protein G8D99_09190 [Acinetobacter lanii]